jgi:hypothetical protein
MPRRRRHLLWPRGSQGPDWLINSGPSRCASCIPLRFRVLLAPKTRQLTFLLPRTPAIASSEAAPTTRQAPTAAVPSGSVARRLQSRNPWPVSLAQAPVQMTTGLCGNGGTLPVGHGAIPTIECVDTPRPGSDPSGLASPKLETEPLDFTTQYPWPSAVRVMPTTLSWPLLPLAADPKL